jgi:aspartyl-tRNA(Asn)/glutamyl-tRNA(Gln) amidotransferase subunit C
MSQQSITPEQIRHVAKLSRLEIPEEKLAGFSSQLGAILGYVGKLSEADVSGVEPMAHALGLVNVLREDVVKPSLPVDVVLRNAPDSDPPYFKVPKVLGGDEDSAG